jgi:hypothetical protein
MLLMAVAAVSLVRAQQQAPAPPVQTSASTQQGPGYAIQRDVDLVVLHASVTNARGQFVPGLMQENFHVFEDKVEQKTPSSVRKMWQ